MRAMLRVQFAYLVDRTVLLFLALLAGIVVVAVTQASGVFLGRTALDAERAMRALSYRTESIIIVRLGVTVVAIFLGMHGFSRMARRAMAFFVTGRSERARFIVARILAGILLLTLYGCVLFAFFVTLGTVGTPYFRAASIDVAMAIDVIAAGCFFFLVQAILTTGVDSVFAAVPSFTLAWFLETRPLVDDPLGDALFAVVRHGGFVEGSYRTAGDPLLQAAILCGLFLLLVSLAALQDGG